VATTLDFQKFEILMDYRISPIKVHVYYLTNLVEG